MVDAVSVTSSSSVTLDFRRNELSIVEDEDDAVFDGLVRLNMLPNMADMDLEDVADVDAAMVFLEAARSESLSGGGWVSTAAEAAASSRIVHALKKAKVASPLAVVQGGNKSGTTTGVSYAAIPSSELSKV